MSYANPAPPEDAGADLRTNDDFRRALLASRPTAEAKKPGASSGNAHKKRPQASRPKRQSDDGAATERYRDRARERRERGEDDDAAGDAVAPAVEDRGVFERAETDAETGARLRAVAESKFLGGDVSRTHLVKGLDFALLQKVRDDIADAKAMRAEESERTEGAREGTGAATFRSGGARAVYEFVTRGAGKADGRAQALASGAVSYSFDLSAASRRDIPTTLQRSTDDDGMAGVRALRAYVDPDKDAGLLVRLGKLMHYLALGSEKAIKKFRRDERRAAEEIKAAERAKMEEEARRARGSAHVEAEALSDEDIFADAGKDYEPTIPTKTQTIGEVGEKSKSFFGDERAGGEASAPAPKAKEIAADDYILEEDDLDRPTNAFGEFGDYGGDYGDYDVDYGMGGFNKHRGGDDPAAAAEAEKKEALRKKRQLGNEFSKIRSMMKEQFGDKDDVAFESEKKSSKRAKKSNHKSNDD